MYWWTDCIADLRSTACLYAGLISPASEDMDGRELLRPRQTLLWQGRTSEERLENPKSKGGGTSAHR